MDQSSEHSLAGSSALGLTRLQSRCRSRAHLKAWCGENLLPNFSGCWPNSFPCSTRSENFNFFLAVGWTQLFKAAHRSLPLGLLCGQLTTQLRVSSRLTGEWEILLARVLGEITITGMTFRQLWHILLVASKWQVPPTLNCRMWMSEGKIIGVTLRYVDHNF